MENNKQEKKLDLKYLITLGTAVVLCGAMLPFAIRGGSSGKDGTNGQNGTNGLNGKSAYELYVDSVPTGTTPLTEAQWLASLQGKDGVVPAYPVASSYAAFIEPIKLMIPDMGEDHYDGDYEERGLIDSASSYIDYLYEETSDFTFKFNAKTGMGSKASSNTEDHYETINTCPDGRDWCIDSVIDATFVRNEESEFEGRISFEYFEDHYAYDFDKDVLNFFVVNDEYYFSWECLELYTTSSVAYKLSQDSYKKVVSSTIDWLNYMRNEFVFEELLEDCPYTNEFIYDRYLTDLIRNAGTYTQESATKFSFSSNNIPGYELNAYRDASANSLEGGKSFYGLYDSQSNVDKVYFNEQEFKLTIGTDATFVPATVAETEQMLTNASAMDDSIIVENNGDNFGAQVINPAIYDTLRMIFCNAALNSPYLDEIFVPVE